MPQGRVEGPFGGGVRCGQLRYGLAGAALFHGLRQVPYGRRDLGRQGSAAQVHGGCGLDQRDHHVQLGQHPYEGGAAAVHPGAAAQHQVVGLVQGVRDLPAALVVVRSSRGFQGVGEGPVSGRHGGALRLPPAQRPAQQGQQEDEQPARAEQQRGRPPGPGERQAGTDHGVEEQQKSGDGGDRADRGDHPGDEGDQGEGAHREPAVAEDQGAQGDSDRAEELRHGDVQDPHPVGVGGVADDPGQGTHRDEGPVLGLVQGEADGERGGHRDARARGRGPGDRGGARPQSLEQPGGRSQWTVPGSPGRYLFGAFGAHSASVRPLVNRFFCAVPWSCVLLAFFWGGLSALVPSELMGCDAVGRSTRRQERRRARSPGSPRRWCAGTR